MDRLKLDLYTVDVGTASDSPAHFAHMITSRVLDSWESGADIVLLPEFCWLAIERHFPGPAPLRAVAECFWQDLWPEIQRDLAHPHKAAVLGTVPWLEPDGTLRNRSPVVSAGRPFYQDKIHLTPWESAFSPGSTMHLWPLGDLKLAVLICFDVEIPSLASLLRPQQPDLLLVPSATENLLGVERVGRCASARAVELGCHVVVTHLVGQATSSLVDENIGRFANYSPSQSPFAACPRQQESGLIDHGWHRHSVTLDMAAIRRLRQQRGETDPSKAMPSASVICRHFT